MLEIKSKTLDYISGGTGSFYITGTSAVSGAFQGFIAAEDTVVSSLLDAQGNEVISVYGVGSQTLSKGAYISAPRGQYFSSITLTSGSVVAFYTNVAALSPVTEGAAFDSDYQAVLNYATTQTYTIPSESQQELQNQLVVDLKDAGVWSKLDLFYVFATDGDSDFASINWKDPNNFEITEVNSPTFTTNEGFQGDGSSSYLDTNFIPSTDSTKSTSNTLSAGGYIINKATSSYDNIIGVDSGSNDILIATKFSSEQPFFRINDSGSFRPSFTTTVGFYGVSRSSFGSTTAILPNGTIENSDRSAASGLPSDILTIQKWAGLYANSTVSCAFYGGNVSSELSDFKTSVDNYITSI